MWISCTPSGLSWRQERHRAADRRQKQQRRRIVLLSSEYDLIKEEVRKLPRLTITTGYSVAVLGVWGRIYIIDVA